MATGRIFGLILMRYGVPTASSHASEIASSEERMSTVAVSMLVPSSNSSISSEKFSADWEVICLTPSTVERLCSSGLVTVVSTVSGV